MIGARLTSRQCPAVVALRGEAWPRPVTVEFWQVSLPFSNLLDPWED